MADPLAPKSTKGVVAAVIGFLVLATAAYGLFWLFTAEEQPSVAVTGTVVSFGMSADYNGNSPMANVRLPDGSARSVAIDSNIQQGCKIGSKIGLMRTGINLEVAPGGCHAKSIAASDD